MNSDKMLFKLHAETCNSFAHPIRLETVYHLKHKVLNCFRTTSGAEIYARIAGFVSTARKHYAERVPPIIEVQEYHCNRHQRCQPQYIKTQSGR